MATGALPRSRQTRSRQPLVLAMMLALAPAVNAEPPETASDASLSGDAIYQKLLDNRFNSYEQKLDMTSGDRGGHFQKVEMEVKYLNFREKKKRIVSKTIAKYQAPQDVRHLGYLVINKSDGSDDQFVFRPSSRRVRRVNLRGEAISGTDFSFEDVLPQEFEDATYARLPDEQLGEIPVYVIALTPVAESDSEYSKMVSWIEKEHFVPLRTRYWDNRDVLIKELDSKPASITMYEDEEKGKTKKVWTPRESKMTHLKLGSFTELEIVELKANPGLREKHFSERELTRSH